MNRLIIIIAISFLVGCNPIPFHRDCDVPKFDLTENIIDVSPFDSSGYFEDYCPAGTPEIFTYRINDLASIGVRIRGDWIDLMPLDNGVPFKVSGAAVRSLSFEGYTQSARISELNEGKLILTLPNKEIIEMNFKFVGCTCVYYDAI